MSCLCHRDKRQTNIFKRKSSYKETFPLGEKTRCYKSMYICQGVCQGPLTKKKGKKNINNTKSTINKLKTPLLSFIFAIGPYNGTFSLS